MKGELGWLERCWLQENENLIGTKRQALYQGGSTAKGFRESGTKRAA
jgi:hypothetical protein